MPVIDFLNGESSVFSSSVLHDTVNTDMCLISDNILQISHVLYFKIIYCTILSVHSDNRAIENTNKWEEIKANGVRCV